MLAFVIVNVSPCKNGLVLISVRLFFSTTTVWGSVYFIVITRPSFLLLLLLFKLLALLPLQLLLLLFLFKLFAKNKSFSV